MFKPPNSAILGKYRLPTSSMTSFDPANMEINEPPTYGVRGNWRRARTRDDFMQFCDFILTYENFQSTKSEEENRRRHSSSPLSSEGSSSESYNSNSTANDLQLTNFRVSKDLNKHQPDSEEDSLDQITCYCGKPFAGRPMIECSTCLTWIHLKCARLRRGHIPDTWNCSKCQVLNNKSNKNKPAKRLSQKRRLNAKKSPATSAGQPSFAPAQKTQRRKLQVPVKNAGEKIIVNSTAPEIEQATNLVQVQS